MDSELMAISQHKTILQAEEKNTPKCTPSADGGSADGNKLEIPWSELPQNVLVVDTGSWGDLQTWSYCAVLLPVFPLTWAPAPAQGNEVTLMSNSFHLSLAADFYLFLTPVFSSCVKSQLLFFSLLSFLSLRETAWQMFASHGIFT